MNLTRFLIPVLGLLVNHAALSAKEFNSTDKPNVLLICVDDLRPELNCFGKSYIHSPNIDRLASNGRAFTRHFVNAPSCGPSRYTLLTGLYGPAGNDALFRRRDRLAKDEEVAPSMPEWFRENGYTTVSVGKISHHPGGLGGPDWNDPTNVEMPNAWDRHLMVSGAWKHPRGIMHGLANGEIRGNPSKMDVYQAVDGEDTTYPDGLITESAISQLEELTGDSNKPFFLAVGFIRPHLPFGAPKRYLDLYTDVELPPIPHKEKPDWKSTWHKSNEFMKYNNWDRDPREDSEHAEQVRLHYAASVSYIDAQIGNLLQKLEATGQAENTIIVLWGDHGWHLGERAIWGKHSLFEESLHAPLIIAYPEMPDQGIQSPAIVETVDIFPTLCELSGLSVPNWAHGVTLVPQLTKPETVGHTALGYGPGATIRDDQFRLIRQSDGTIELYEFEGISRVHAKRPNTPEIIDPLIKELNRKLAIRSH